MTQHRQKSILKSHQVMFTWVNDQKRPYSIFVVINLWACSYLSTNVREFLPSERGCSSNSQRWFFFFLFLCFLVLCVCVCLWPQSLPSTLIIEIRVLKCYCCDSMVGHDYSLFVHSTSFETNSGIYHFIICACSTLLVLWKNKKAKKTTTEPNQSIILL